MPCYDGDLLIESMVQDDNFNVIPLLHFGIPAVAQGEVHPNLYHLGYPKLHSQFSVSLYPSGAMNRIDFNNQSPPRQEDGIAMRRQSWGWAYAQSRGKTAPVNLGLKAEVLADKKIRIDYEYYCREDISSDYKLHLAIRQSNIKAYQRGQGDEYIHNYVCREFLFDTEGELVDPNATETGASSIKTVEYQLPDYYGNGPLPGGGGAPVLKEMDVILFMTNGQGQVINALALGLD